MAALPIIIKKNKIQELDYVLLKKDTNMKVVQVISNKPVAMCKMKFVLDGLVGHGYGSSFRLQSDHLIKIKLKECLDDKDDEVDGFSTRDNRNLVDKRENQRLSKEEILRLRQQGMTGEGIVGHLIENSSTFQDKTEFSQQKYVEKKKKKHVTVFTVLRPCTRNLVEMYFSRGPTKICNLRMDSLAQILMQANIQAFTKTMVVESCSGLVLGAILERIGGEGAVVHLYTGSAPTRPAFHEGYHFSEEILQNLYDFPLNEVNTLKRSSSVQAKSSADGSHEIDSKYESVVDCDNRNSVHSDNTEVKQEKHVENKTVENAAVFADGDGNRKESDVIVRKLAESRIETKSTDKKHTRKRKFDDMEEREIRRLRRMAQKEKTKLLIEQANMDGLIVAAKVHPTPIVMSLIDFVAPSRPIVIFSPYKEPLIDCFVKLRERGGVVMIKLSETWFREYQVLTDRTHPSITMSGSGGYMLTATTISLH